MSFVRITLTPKDIADLAVRAGGTVSEFCGIRIVSAPPGCDWPKELTMLTGNVSWMLPAQHPVARCVRGGGTLDKLIDEIVQNIRVAP